MNFGVHDFRTDPPGSYGIEQYPLVNVQKAIENGDL